MYRPGVCNPLDQDPRLGRIARVFDVGDSHIRQIPVDRADRLIVSRDHDRPEVPVRVRRDLGFEP